MSNQENNVSTMNNSNCTNTPNGATTEIKTLISKLEDYNSCFGVDLENLFDLFTDQMGELHDELRQGCVQEALCRLNKMFSLIYVIKDKLPISVFDYVERLTFSVKCQLKSA